ncbi:hypothetical protein L6R46_30940, partial [Myxococcota bacterium]|nr:hypothetical protein [Myxococcota bacterium]
GGRLDHGAKAAFTRWLASAQAGEREAGSGRISPSSVADQLATTAARSSGLRQLPAETAQATGSSWGAPSSEVQA